MPQSQRDATGERSISLAEGHEMTGVQDVLYDSTHLALIHNVKTGGKFRSEVQHRRRI
jgi:hypothetical protein